LKFLVDNALSPAVAEGLRQAGHDASHVRDYRMAASEDDEVFMRSAREDRILVSGDTDFGAILALRRLAKPSVILFRLSASHRPDYQLSLLLANLDDLSVDLERGCIVVFEDRRIRVRRLPISD